MKNKKIVTALIFIVLVVYILFQPVYILVIKNFHDNEILFRKHIHPGYTFATLIKHSVHKSPVYEFYKVDKNGTIIITGTTLQDLGWGVPSTFDYDFKFENDMLVIENINKPIEFVPFRVSYIAKPHLILNNNMDIDLTKVVDNYERVDISVIKMPYLIYKIRGDINAF